ncbi:hypothetical protein M0654_06400 [Rhizobium sp. NTR19]|uniref:Uncharacterized protein n=1 Tax=Neorhizobium turbinariae TaxID=2937795 RepID=A0ABT0IP21_9HYPH|nr:hypothetical protein [Neorhizobium turbinariae]MCK8779615.1 hypothetical protein [Neorhizobium turbinariae]
MADVKRRRFAVAVPHQHSSQSTAWIYKMWDWFPLVVLPFKLIVLGTGMFFAIKWHHDQAKKK